MALEVISRPEKTMSDGFKSRWNGSRTPLNYKFESDLFPVNTIDDTATIQNLEYRANKLGTLIQFSQTVSSLSLQKGDYVRFDSTNTLLDGNSYKIKEIVSSTEVIISVRVTGSFSTSGTAQKYYKGYKAIVRVYVGSPTYHSFFKDGSKPQYLASVMEVEFGNDNQGTGNVRQFIKPDINSDFDDQTRNSHFAWTSFFIEFGETWDNKSGGISFTRDILQDCLPFTGFDDPTFSNGLDDWLQRDIFFGFSDWVVVSGGVQATIPNSPNTGTDVIYQDLGVRTGNQYEITINASLNPGAVNNEYSILVVDENNSYIGSVPFDISLSGQDYKILFNPQVDSTSIGIQVRIGNPDAASNFRINSLSIEANGGLSSPCDYSSFAVFGSKQFQDPIGGNFGDYVLRTFASNEAPKMLTYFDQISIFPNSSFKTVDGTNRTFFLELRAYFNAIIPASIIYLSEGGDSVFLQIDTFLNNGTAVESNRQRLSLDDDGVYSFTFLQGGLIEFDYGFAQFVIVPGNTLVDGDRGTYENTDTSTWDISTIGIGVGEQIYNFNGNQYGNFIGFSIGLNEGIYYDLIKFDTDINTVVGKEYVIESDVLLDKNQISNSLLNGNISFYFGVDGIDESNLQIQFIDSNTDQENQKQGKIFTKFTATSTTHNITHKVRSNIDGSDIYDLQVNLKNTTFKGPIDYISEKKPIKLNTDCFGYKGVAIRWKNTLGGWEYWKFKQYQDVKEKFSKTEIKKDIFTDYDNYFINGNSQYQAISVDSRKSITVRSGLLTENDLINVSQLQRSIEIQYLADTVINDFGNPVDKWQTVSIKSGSFTSLEERNKIREISFDIELVDTLTQEL